MTQELRNWAIEKTYNLIHAWHCQPELQKCAQDWLDAVGTDSERKKLEEFLEMAGDYIRDLDYLISFLEKEKVQEYFGVQYARAFLESSRVRKAAGEKYCGCPACTAAQLIISRKAELLA